ncbi:MAG TPA: glycosyltransferase family 4 protein [Gemmatimonadaceae bacterium]
MSVSALLAALAVSAIASWIGTGWARRYTLSRSILDQPNERSSHVNATPRGGGIALAAVTLGFIIVTLIAGIIPGRIGGSMLVAGAMIAGIGWLDDHRHVGAGWRALVHFAAAIIVVTAIDGMRDLRVGAGSAHLGIVGSIVAVLTIVWLINLYNFMDGIDGIAGVNAITVGLSGGLLLYLAGDATLSAIALVTAAAAAGFLVWNWPPAKIFMGDVGSGFLGFIFGALAVTSEARHSVPLIVWALLLGVFLVDSTVTLIRRISRGEKWYSAHRSHAYQRLVHGGSSHARVTGSVAALNVGLLALALAAYAFPAAMLVVVATGLGALGLLYYWVERKHPM